MAGYFQKWLHPFLLFGSSDICKQSPKFSSHTKGRTKFRFLEGPYPHALVGILLQGGVVAVLLG